MAGEDRGDFTPDDLRILKTLVEMFRDRGYTFPSSLNPQELIENQTLLANTPGFHKKVTSMDQMVRDDRGTPIFVLILKDDEGYTGSKQKEQVAKNVSRMTFLAFSHLDDDNLITPGNKSLENVIKQLHLFVIFRHERKPNKNYDYSKYEIESIVSGGYNYEVWSKHRLRFNPTKHSLVGKHVKLSEDEAEDYKTQFSVTDQQIQKMFLDDPMNRWYYGQPGTIYRIHRVQQGINYRIVSRKLLSSLKTK